MAQEQEFECAAHPVRYGYYRQQKVYFAYPDEVNGETGLMLLISGFGGKPEANVYKKMRMLFAEQYNLIVVQSTYVGMEFMGDCDDVFISDPQLQKLRRILPRSMRDKVFQADGSTDFSPLMDNNLTFTIPVQICAELHESEENFVEMGPLQAIDCVRALKVVYDIVKDNGYEINLDTIIAYGHSHGAYLAHLCNRFFPNVFSYILDNSAWISPVYLKESRVLTQRINNLILQKTFTYRIASLNYDRQIYDLRYLYNGFDNKANLVIYQGVTDNLIDHKAKQAVFQKVPHVTFNMITADKVDGVAIKSTNHGDADFIELFHKEAQENTNSFSKQGRGNPFGTTECVKTSQSTYKFGFLNGSPYLEIISAT